MKILLALQSGFSRSLRGWKGILVFWFLSFAMVSLIVIPLKAGLNAALGQSMITEKLMKGINFDVLGDLGKNLRLIGSSLASGMILLGLAAIVLDIFITGGLFGIVRRDSDKATSENIFRDSVRNFWPFMIISLVIYIILALLIVFLVVIPASVAGNAASAPEGLVFRVLEISAPVFGLALSVLLLVADYARAWQAARYEHASFKAIGFGFSQTFRTILPSVALMLIMMLLQLLVALAVFKLIASFTPVRGGGVFLLFILSQLLLILKFFFKVVRFAGVTALMELYAPGAGAGSANLLITSGVMPPENNTMPSPENIHGTDYTLKL